VFYKFPPYNVLGTVRGDGVVLCYKEFQLGAKVPGAIPGSRLAVLTEVLCAFSESL
jgi:hypothetical protein